MDKVLGEIEGLTENANAVKELVVSKLVNKGMLSRTDAHEFSSKYQVIIIKPTWFNKWKDFLFKEDNDYVFKLVNLKED